MGDTGVTYDRIKLVVQAVVTMHIFRGGYSSRDLHQVPTNFEEHKQKVEGGPHPADVVDRPDRRNCTGDVIPSREEKQQEQNVNLLTEGISRINVLTQRPYSRRYFDLLAKRKKLPVWEMKSKILKLIDENRIVILAGEPGAGKTTQIPQFLLEAGYAASGKRI
eukprot:707079_1